MRSFSSGSSRFHYRVATVQAAAAEVLRVAGSHYGSRAAVEACCALLALWIAEITGRLASFQVADGTAIVASWYESHGAGLTAIDDAPSVNKA